VASLATPAGEHLSQAQEIAAQWAQGAPLAFAASKEAINAATLTELDDSFDRELKGQTDLRASQDFAEGVAAFIEKRGANFSGE
jgi:enoyl-CoA hydratase